MSQQRPTMRSAMRRVRHLGSARSGTEHFWRQRLTSVALVPLTIAFVLMVISLTGRNHAATVQILGSPLVSILMLLFLITSIYHMWLGMQVIIEDYFHSDGWKYSLLMGNSFFAAAVALTCVFAILKMSFGV